VASDDYQWVAHQAAVETFLRLTPSDRKAVISTILNIAQNPFRSEADSFELPDQAPYFVQAIGNRVLTFQVDHAIKEVRILSLE